MIARPMPPAPPVTSATLPCSSPGLGRLRELVELQRPVLDGEGLGGVQGHELAQRLGAGDDLDRAVIEVARDLRQPSSSCPSATMPMPSTSTMRASGSPGTSTVARVLLEVALVVGAVARRPARRCAPAWRPRARSTAAGAWCARGGPGTARRPSPAARPARSRRTPSRARTCRRSAPSRARSDTAPRIAGSSSCSDAGRLEPCGRRSAGRRPCAALTNATAWLMTSIVLR